MSAKREEDRNDGSNKDNGSGWHFRNLPGECGGSPPVRLKFGRDIYKDLRSLEKSVGNSDESESSLDTFSLELFENIAFIMAYHVDPQNTPHDPDEWLEQFNTFSIYQILPEIINLWGLNVQQQVDSKKT